MRHMMEMPVFSLLMAFVSQSYYKTERGASPVVDKGAY